MSHKIQLLSAQGTIVPQTVDRFVVYVQGILTSPIKAYSTTLPNKLRSDVVVNVTGQPVHLPGKSQVSGRWTVSLYEDMTTEVAQQIQLMKRFVSSTKSETPHHHILSTVTVFVTDQYTGTIPLYWVTLLGCWIESIDEAQLDWSRPGTPVVWKVNIRYSDLTRNPLDSELKLPMP